MYVGHAAIALAIRARRPDVPLAPLVIASYGPDWAELILGLFEGRAEMREVTHTIPAVIACALAAAAAYALFTNRGGAGAVLLAWLLHWPADFLTAQKPLFGTNDLVGLDLYNLPAADFAVESFLVVVCCVMYARAFARTPAHRRWVVAMAALLIGMQGGLDFGLARAGTADWHPVLAGRHWRSHPTSSALPGSDRRRLRMRLALSPHTLTASAQWRRIVLGRS